MKFVDPKKPIATCTSERCENCTLNSSLHCHFTPGDLTHFLVIALPPFLLGGAGICHVNSWMLIPWVIVILGYFGFIEIRVMCSHCPHYAEEGATLKCWANYGSPKIWKYRPGPMTATEKTIFLSGFAVIWGYPVIFLVSGLESFLLTVYILTTLAFFMRLRIFLCSQCMNFACPLNTVKEEVRRSFFERNSSVAKAWSEGITGSE